MLPTSETKVADFCSAAQDRCPKRLDRYPGFKCTVTIVFPLLNHAPSVDKPSVAFAKEPPLVNLQPAPFARRRSSAATSLLRAFLAFFPLRSSREILLDVTGQFAGRRNGNIVHREQPPRVTMTLSKRTRGKLTCSLLVAAAMLK